MQSRFFLNRFHNVEMRMANKKVKYLFNNLNDGMFFIKNILNKLRLNRNNKSLSFK
jgi:DNA polymerase III delta subunit